MTAAPGGATDELPGTQRDEVFRAPKGFYDLVGADAARCDALDSLFHDTAERYGYGRVRVPLLEHTEVFERAVGEATDVVRKEMYTFTDRGGRSLTLRPEGTAGVVRCFVEHHLDQSGLPWKVSYGGPMFRAENVQRGRNRQFFQLGVEAVGVDDPALDVEVIALGCDVLASLGLRDVLLKVNTLGTPEERRGYTAVLRDWVCAQAGTLGALGADDLERLELNPLRILDTKDPQLAAALVDAPTLRGHVGDASAAHFDAVCRGLDAAGIGYEIDDRLVRGLDYYTSTTFEWAGLALDAAQNALGGGGHYDGLVAEAGGPDLPGIGFALGVERILLACDAEDVFAAPATGPSVMVLRTGDVDAVAHDVLRSLRAAGVRADTPYGGRSLKAQFKAADRLGAAVAVVVGERDVADGNVTLRDLRSGEQRTVAIDVAVAEVIEELQR